MKKTRARYFHDYKAELRAVITAGLLDHPDLGTL